MQQLIIIGAIIAGILFIRWLMRQPRGKRWRWALAAVAVVLAALAATGRLNWMIAVGAAAVPMLAKLFALLRFAPLLVRLLHNVRFGKQNFSNFRSRSLVIEVNPLTGTVDGKVLAGRFSGRRLAGLSQSELKTLADELARDDPQAAALLKSYLVMRERGSSQQQQQQQQQHSRRAHGGEQMSAERAHQILGLKPGCSKKEITAAHRRLIQRLHPDQGGSAHLASLINQARDCLLER